MRQRKLCGIMMSVVLAVSLLSAGCQKQVADVPDPTLGKAEDFLAGGYQAITESRSDTGSIDLTGYVCAAESDELKLLYHEWDGAIAVVNKVTGFVWTSSIDYQKAGITRELNKLWNNKFGSLVYLHYYETGRNKGVDTVTNAKEEGARIRITQEPDGLRISYVYTILEIRFDIVITLSGRQMTIRVPFDSIREGKKYRITSLTLLPAFGAAFLGEEGYAFYPDGCGAISSFTDENIKPNSPQYSFPVYGTSEIDIDRYRQDIQERKPTVMVPAYGMKRGDNAYVAYITQGEYDGVIEYTPGTFVADCSCLCTRFRYREAVDLSEVGSNGISTGEDEEIKKFTESILQKDCEVVYSFLEGEEADYSGMAKSYREYLNESGKIAQSATGSALGVDLFMGIYEKRALLDSYISMTTYAQARSILTELINESGMPLVSTLIGWNKGGYGEYPANYQSESRLGGGDGLKKLIDGVPDAQLFLSADSLFLKSSGGGFSLRDDAVYSAAGIPVTNFSKKWYLAEPAAMFQKFLPSSRKTAQSVGTGLSLENVGYYVINHSHGEESVTRGQYIEYAQDFAQGCAEAGVPVCTQGNLYMLSDITSIRGVPCEDSQLDITDRAVPFYQMLVHGRLPYFSAPGNTADDPGTQKLRWIEYGYCPTFELTFESPEHLRYTEYNRLFTSCYSRWKDTVLETAKEWEEGLVQLAGKPITRHLQLQDGVFQTVFEDQSVIVNYNEAPVTIEGVVVEGKSYQIVDGVL